MFWSELNIDWEAFHFLRETVLWLLIPLLVIYVLSVWGVRDSVKWSRVIPAHLKPYLVKKGSENLKLGLLTLSFLAMTIGILGLAGPTWDKVQVPGQKVESPMVIALDLSQSMLCDDVQPTRLDRAKFKIRDLIKQDPKARIALMVFAGSSHTVVPLTKDYKIIESYLEGLSPSIMPLRGSDIASALNMTDTIVGSIEAPSTLVFLTDDFTDESFEMFQNYSTKFNGEVVIMPMSTPTGAEVPAFNGRGALRVDGKVVYSSLDQEIVKKLESKEGITISPLTLDDSDMEIIADNVRSELVFQSEKNEEKDQWIDRGYWLMIPLVVIVLMLFRKGVVLYSLSILMLCAGCSYDRPTKFNDLWASKDYQGQVLQDHEKYELAAERYQNPLRKGIAYYKSGDYANAIKAFSEDTTAMGQYNLGLAYYKSGNLEGAEISFQKALELDPAMSIAVENSEVVSQLMQGENEVSLEQAQEANNEKGNAQNLENTSPEDLGGGGQEATKEDMEKGRLEETVATDIRLGKELEEVPEDLGAIGKQDMQKILIRDTEDDPTSFLRKKFAYQVKEEKIATKNPDKVW
ncbi:vWA domain-containing protein [Aureibacter tunicatorum]|uniref:Ca-activated chloride channel family protein n=1 Tax=Aureibacter tunicatorum TaxID=866807 RepID=A0AAE3XKE4_9BACT|nr:VWA domain-containing protein [Aureibacter tunicatorum]MDR6238042.1 Ca-activated chloride channel family protein [Aureibacter tunicatorum]BDD03075.1 membrane protein [Aureibacter tunicatorum]